MPMFSKMRSSYPFQLIQGIPHSVKFAAGVGAGAGAYDNRNHRVGGAVRGGLLGAGIATGALGYDAMGGTPGLQTFGRNMMRSGNARMLGSLLASQGRSTWSSAASIIGRML